MEHNRNSIETIPFTPPEISRRVGASGAQIANTPFGDPGIFSSFSLSSEVRPHTAFSGLHRFALGAAQLGYRAPRIWRNAKKMPWEQLPGAEPKTAPWKSAALDGELF